MLLGAAYSLWLCNRILFGNVKVASIQLFQDLTRLEVAIILPFISLTFVLGLFPDLLVTVFINSVYFY